MQTEISDDSSDYDDDVEDEEYSSEDVEDVVHIGDKFVLSGDEGGDDSTLNVKRIVHGGVVYVEEDDDTCCLSYVRRKVSIYQS